MAGEFGGGGVTGALGGIVGAIASAIRGFFAITAAELLRFLNFLKELILQLSHDLFIASFRIARALARGIRAFAYLAVNGLRSFVQLAWEKFQALEAFLKEKFAPVLLWLKELKQHVQDIYNKFVRPIVDTIEFIRRLNSILQVFHIDLLSKLDSVLAKVEQRIEEPFLWVTKKITWLENWIDRIVTIDGLYRRAVLLSSLSRYAPSWIAGFWNGQIDRDALALKAGQIPTEYPAEPPETPGDELGELYRGDSSALDEDVDALLPIFLEAAGLNG